ncbi:hypothetical protein [Aliivibrio logei]|uniref:Uncharacterized protein n=1 Tax=Aliivibrio logei TaxID=688 RepID=A0A1B9NTZ4_ALILO|nr:hypothetical protein [Aliivibrio logei]OCH17130.1 hypothetical protein A6E04_19960 [Aliivibrio logei]
MTNDELFNLTDWYHENVIDNNLVSIINQSNSHINNLLKNPTNRKTTLEVVFNDITEALVKMDLSTLSIDDKNILIKLGLNNIILDPAFFSLSNLLLTNESDLHTISARFISMSNIVKTADANFRSLKHTLPQLFEPKKPDDINPEKVFTRLTFHNDASINNVVNLKEWSSSWNTIARGYSMTLGKTPEEFEIISASKGSIIFDLLLNLETVNMIGETFNHIADFAFTMIEIKAALKGLSYFKKNDVQMYEDLKKKLDADMDKKRDSMADDIAQRLFDKHAIDKENNEVKVNLKHGVKELSKFVDKGGDVSFKSNNVEYDEQVLLVNDALLMLQNSSKEQKLIEDKTTDIE